MDAVSSDLPLEGSVVAIAQLHTEHHQEASAIERGIDRATAAFGRPASLGFLSLIVCLWVGVSLMLSRMGVAPFDPPPVPLARQRRCPDVSLHGHSNPGHSKAGR